VLPILHEFILAEKSDLFHTPNLRLLKNIPIFKVSPTLKYFSSNFLPRYHPFKSPSPTGGLSGFFIATSSDALTALTALLKKCIRFLKNPDDKSYQECET
jgi:hypothetical protein